MLLPTDTLNLFILFFLCVCFLLRVSYLPLASTGKICRGAIGLPDPAGIDDRVIFFFFFDILELINHEKRRIKGAFQEE